MKQGPTDGFTEKIQVAGEDLLDRVKELVAQGNVRRLTVRNKSGKVLVQIPLNLGVAGGGVAVLAAPWLVVLGGIAGLLSDVTIEVERTDIIDVESIIIDVDEQKD